ncbi:hypothetical protein AAHA92_06519 [Salvia divinorum]|uniref:Uncharacterized protein n=1 Tax=Salvia divinorum TaxID=28513 RepID=A0ABD1I5Z2_SALDI
MAGVDGVNDLTRFSNVSFFVFISFSTHKSYTLLTFNRSPLSQPPAAVGTPISAIIRVENYELYRLAIVQEC